MKKRSAYPILNMLKKLNLEPTRENYLALDRWGPNPELTAEEEFESPPQFRRRLSRPPMTLEQKQAAMRSRHRRTCCNSHVRVKHRRFCPTQYPRPVRLEEHA